MDHGHHHHKHSEQPHAHDVQGHGDRDNHGNPFDLQGYLARIEAPERDEWQMPDEVIARLDLRNGARVVDIGAGPGYFSLRLAKAVGPDGHVFAVDVEPKLLQVLVTRLAERDIRNVTPVLAAPNLPMLPRLGFDCILLVNTYHHMPDGPGYLRALAELLGPGGCIVDIDFHATDLPVGPPQGHKKAAAAVLEDASRAGLLAKEWPAVLPHQYGIVITRP